MGAREQSVRCAPQVFVPELGQALYCVGVTSAHFAQLEQTVRSPSSRYYGPSVRDIHHPECQVPKLGDAFGRK
jgi:hypothetical protein